MEVLFSLLGQLPVLNHRFNPNIAQTPLLHVPKLAQWLSLVVAGLSRFSQQMSQSDGEPLIARVATGNLFWTGCFGKEPGPSPPSRKSFHTLKQGGGLFSHTPSACTLNTARVHQAPIQH